MKQSLPCSPPTGTGYFSATTWLVCILLWVFLCPACIQSEEVDFTPDQLRERNRLLVSCGQGHRTPVIPADPDLSRMLDAWREAVALWQHFSLAEQERLITPIRVRYVDAIFVVDAYYLLDWLYLPFETQAEILDPTDSATLRRVLGESLRKSGIGPLPSWRAPMSQQEAHETLERGCVLDLVRLECPPVRALAGELWYEPPTREGVAGVPALRLRDGGLCCSGLERGCI